MDTEIQPREPNEKQKAAAYDRFVAYIVPLHAHDSAVAHIATILRSFALEAPDGSKEG